MNAKDQIKFALINAMDKQVAFSWVKTHEVQKGVYIKHSQSFFQTYMMK